MSARIADLYLQEISFETGNNEDWNDAWAYVDANGAPIPLGGISFYGMVKSEPGSNMPRLILATADIPETNVNIPRADLVIGGAGGNVIAINAPAAIMRKLTAGSLVLDIVARAEGRQRRAAIGSLNLIQGVTR